MSTMILQAYRMGHSVSQSFLAQCYYWGKAAPQCKQVWKDLGDMYDKGLGGPEDLEKAVSCYQKAAAAGVAEAGEALGRYKKTLLGKWKRKA